MKKLINAVAGDGKNTSPARKYAAYAIIITAIAFVLALVILIVSSIAFAVTDGRNDTPVGDNASGDGDVGGGTLVSSTLQYEAITADKLEAKTDKLVLLADKRTTSENVALYYGIAPKSSLKLTESVAKATDLMLVDFYTENVKTLNVSTSDEKKCDLPLVTDASDDGMSFSVERYEGNDVSIAGDSKYEWIFKNAYKYGFVCKDNTFTYVGAPISTYMKTKNIATVEAFIKALNGKNVSVSVASIGESKATAYQVYYLAKDAELKAPSNYEYSVVANGADGYFIIVNMSKKVQAESSETTDGGVG